MRSLMRGHVTAAVPVLVALLWSGAVLNAHEIGTTLVTATFHEEGGYDIEILTDAASLVEKLDALAGVQPSSFPAPSLSAAALLERLRARENLFRQRVAIAFDGVSAAPAIRYAVTPPADAMSPPLATIHLAGEKPRHTQRFTWSYSWTFASYALTMKNGDEAEGSTEWLEGGQPSTAFSLTAPAPRVSRARIAWRYLALGFTHIVPHGLDHMLFVLGIFLFSGRLRTVLWQVSAFTLAHSLTLGLSIYGVIAVSPSLVEPMIAISIAYVAVENLVLTELKSWRIVLVFAFGLLHGMGFAGALQELGMPRSEFLTALLTFNVGVEAGQLAVIGAAFLLVGWWCSERAWYRHRVVVPASLAIACTAVYWTVERLGL
jgi:hydrogenase/urease accessory protein HupE